MVARSNVSGYTGSGYVDYQNPNNDYVEWTLSVPAAGTYALQFRYALAGSNRPLTLAINGNTIQSDLSFPSTGDWEQWEIVTAYANLSAGRNSVRLTATGQSGANIDSLTVAKANHDS